MRFVLALLALTAIGSRLMTQTYSHEERLQGYAIRFDTTIFVFDPAVYGTEAPERVIATGSWRGWSTNMDDPELRLQQVGDVWTKLVPDTGHTLIPPNSEFKFVVDPGGWLEPPLDAENTKGGNLVYLMGAPPPSVHAEIRDKSTIRATFESVNAPLNPAGYRLTDGAGNEIPIAAVLPNTRSTVLVVPADSLDPKRPHFLEVPALELRSLCFYWIFLQSIDCLLLL